ncbi:hypothetical protein WICMUC_004071 [Wickerhamomyces mucosus]|uniref:Uncharacterized protein n=1 Tax=Wickerhamomyces mucosus TaxID=1378264 RepID=A0A9P8PK24_9ASCO|nr:hypothetical protein WICMUC_004071 [Wickerhamomyces mucosus]
MNCSVKNPNLAKRTLSLNNGNNQALPVFLGSNKFNGNTLKTVSGPNSVIALAITASASNLNSKSSLVLHSPMISKGFKKSGLALDLNFVNATVKTSKISLAAEPNLTFNNSVKISDVVVIISSTSS